MIIIWSSYRGRGSLHTAQEADALLVEFSSPLRSFVLALLIIDIKSKPGNEARVMCVLACHAPFSFAFLLLCHFKPTYMHTYTHIHTYILRSIGAGKRWQEVFKLPTPEAASVQVALLFDVIGLLERSDSYAGPVDASMHLLGNISAMLDAALEKAVLPLEFVAKAVQSIHHASYLCPPEVRRRIKETPLADTRNALVAR